MKKVLIFLLFTFISFSIAYATKPGARVEPLDRKILITDLYFSGVGLKDSKITAANFLWIPQDAIQECLGKNGKDCEQEVNSKKVERQGIPTRVLQTWVYDAPTLTQMMDSLFIQEIIKEERGEVYFAISESKKIKAEISWERWPDFGEIFTIHKLFFKN